MLLEYTCCACINMLPAWGAHRTVPTARSQQPRKHRHPPPLPAQLARKTGVPEGTSGQICAEILLNPVFQPQLDTAIVSGKKTLQRWVMVPHCRRAGRVPRQLGEHCADPPPVLRIVGGLPPPSAPICLVPRSLAHLAALLVEACHSPHSKRLSYLPTQLLPLAR